MKMSEPSPRPEFRARPARMKDYFSSMTELMEHLPARDNYSIASDVGRRSAVKVFAPHAGCIEPCTGALVLAIAMGRYDYFVFNGLRKKDCYKTLHVTSTHYDEPSCIRMARESTVALAIHGCDGEDLFIEVGGGNSSLASRLAESMIAAGYPALPAPAERRGEDPANFINKASRHGLQIELSAGFRRSLFPAFPRALSRDPRTFHPFVAFMQGWIDSVQGSFS